MESPHWIYNKKVPYLYMHICSDPLLTSGTPPTYYFLYIQITSPIYNTTIHTSTKRKYKHHLKSHNNIFVILNVSLFLSKKSKKKNYKS